MKKVKLLKVISFQGGDDCYNSSLLIPFVSDHLGWEEIEKEDYLHLIAWVRAQKDYILIDYSENFTVADAIKQQKEKAEILNKKLAERSEKEKARISAAAKRKEEKEINKLKKLAEKFPDVVSLKKIS
jgi:hypothetical protein